MPFLERCRTEPGTIVADLNLHPIPAPRRVDGDGSAFTPRRDGVLDAVLDQRLYRQPWHAAGAPRLVDLDRIPQPIAESHPLDLQVVAHHVDLFAERHERRALLIERRSQQRRELHRHALGARRVVVDERGDRVERVEQKVRLNAVLERRQLRFGGDPARLRFVALLRPQRHHRVVEPGPHRFDR